MSTFESLDGQARTQVIEDVARFRLLVENDMGADHVHPARDRPRVQVVDTDDAWRFDDVLANVVEIDPLWRCLEQDVQRLAQQAPRSRQARWQPLAVGASPRCSAIASMHDGIPSGVAGSATSAVEPGGTERTPETRPVTAHGIGWGRRSRSRSRSCR
jgi:hypothetical protein